VKNRIIAALLLVLLSAAGFALYSDPPFSEVAAHNAALAPALNDSYDPSIAAGGTIGMDFYGTDIYWAPIHRHFDFQLINASARLAAIEPSVDGSISPSTCPVLLFAWGSNATPLAAKDWEGDDCVEYQNDTSVSRAALVTFTFGNTSVQVSTSNDTVPLPQEILEAMEGTNGNDSLSVLLNATFNFTYVIDDRKPSHDEGCSHHLVNYSSVINVLDERNWTVEGNRSLFFLAAPALGEQWFRDNRFDTIILTNSRIYSGNISADGNQTRSFRLLWFNITNDSLGVWQIVSVPANDSTGIVAEHLAYNTPTPLDSGNFTYGYAYELNYSYEGLGEHALQDDASGLFGARFVFKRDILSRMLSYSGNMSESGEPADLSVTRKSVPFFQDAMRPVELSIGLAGVLLVVLLTKRIVSR